MHGETLPDSAGVTSSGQRTGQAQCLSGSPFPCNSKNLLGVFLALALICQHYHSLHITTPDCMPSTSPRLLQVLFTATL